MARVLFFLALSIALVTPVEAGRLLAGAKGNEKKRLRRARLEGALELLAKARGKSDLQAIALLEEKLPGIFASENQLVWVRRAFYQAGGGMRRPRASSQGIQRGKRALKRMGALSLLEDSAQKRSFLRLSRGKDSVLGVLARAIPEAESLTQVEELATRLSQCRQALEEIEVVAKRRGWDQAPKQKQNVKALFRRLPDEELAFQPRFRCPVVGKPYRFQDPIQSPVARCEVHGSRDDFHHPGLEPDAKEQARIRASNVLVRAEEALRHEDSGPSARALACATRREGIEGLASRAYQLSQLEGLGDLSEVWSRLEAYGHRVAGKGKTCPKAGPDLTWVRQGHWIRLRCPNHAP